MGQPMITERVLTDGDVREARAMTGFAFWAGPIAIAVVIITLVLLSMGTIDKLLSLLFLALLGLYTGFMIVPRLPEYGRIRNDLAAGIVKMLEAAPEKVRMGRTGFCYASFGGSVIRVSNNRYKELRDSNLVKIAFLPTSLVAVGVEIERGIGRAAPN
jgi:hypothetical protein